MRILVSAMRMISVLGNRRPAAVLDLPQHAFAVLVICCTVACALHGLPASMRLDVAGASDQQRPRFSMQTVGESVAAACESSSAAASADAAGGGGCELNPFGASRLAPGVTVRTQMRVTATGPAPIDVMSLRPLAGCEQNRSAGAGDFCRQLHLRIEWGSQRVFDGSAEELGRQVDAPITLTAPPVHGALLVTTDVSLPSTLGNDYQGLAARLPLLVTASA